MSNFNRGGTRGGQRGGHGHSGGRGGRGGHNNNNNRPYTPNQQPQQQQPAVNQQPAPAVPQQPAPMSYASQAQKAHVQQQQAPAPVAQPTPAPAVVTTPVVAQPQAAQQIPKPVPKNQNNKELSAPLRTASAPPDLEPQEKQHARLQNYIPIKSTPAPVPQPQPAFNQHPYAAPHQPYYYPPHIPHNPHFAPMNYMPPQGMPPQGAPSQQSSFKIVKPPKSSAIKIVNPSTGEEVKIHEPSKKPEDTVVQPVVATPVVITKPVEAKPVTVTPAAAAAAVVEPAKPVVVAEAPKPVVVEVKQQPEAASKPKEAAVESQSTPIADKKVADNKQADEDTEEEPVSAAAAAAADDDVDDDSINDDDDEIVNDEEDEDETAAEDDKKASETIEVPKPDAATGKRLYTKDFLLKFKPLCNTPPENIKFNKDIFNTDGNSPTSPKGMGRNSGGSRGGNNLKNNRNGSGGKRDGGRGGRGGKSRTPAKREKPAWIAKLDQDEHSTTYAEVTDILNKLAPEKYERLLHRFLTEVKIPNIEVMNECIVLIFDKAVLEPKFSDIYAALCYDLSEKLKIPDQSESNNAVFKKMLLNKCQEEFESKEQQDQEQAKKLEAAAAAAAAAAASGEDGSAAPSSTPSADEEQMTQSRKRMVGTIIFIGELYKKKMLSERIMHDVIHRLLIAKATPDEADLEVLCRLLATIGQLLDHEKAAKHMNGYFDRIKALNQDKSLNSRTRFMLLDTMELRLNNWVPRVKQEKAKKINEIKQDIENEKLKQEQDLKKMTANSGGNNNRRQGGSRGGRGGHNDRRQGGNNNNNNNNNNKLSVNTSTSRYGNRGNNNTPSSYGSSGSKGWSNRNNGDNGNGGDDSNSTSSTPTKQESQNRFKLISDDVYNAPDSPSADSSQQEDKEEWTSESVTKHVKTLVGDLMEQEEISEGMQDLKKVLNDETGREYTKQVILTFIVEGAKQTGGQETIAQMLAAICNEKVFTNEQFVEGLQAVYQATVQNELSIESPQQFKNIAELSGRLVAHGAVTLAQVGEQFSTVIAAESTANSCADFVACIYGGIQKQAGSVSFDQFAEQSLNVLLHLNPSKLNELERYVKGLKAYALDDKDPATQIIAGINAKTAASDMAAWVKNSAKLVGKQYSVPFSSKAMTALIAAIECNSTFARTASDDVEQFDKYAPLVEAVFSSCADASAFKLQFLSDLAFVSSKAKNDAVFTRVAKWAKNKSFITKESTDEWAKTKGGVSNKAALVATL